MLFESFGAQFLAPVRVSKYVLAIRAQAFTAWSIPYTWSLRIRYASARFSASAGQFIETREKQTRVLASVRNGFATRRRGATFWKGIASSMIAPPKLKALIYGKRKRRDKSDKLNPMSSTLGIKMMTNEIIMIEHSRIKSSQKTPKWLSKSFYPDTCSLRIRWFCREMRLAEFYAYDVNAVSNVWPIDFIFHHISAGRDRL